LRIFMINAQNNRECDGGYDAGPPENNEGYKGEWFGPTENQRRYLLWRCAPSSEVRGRRAGNEGGCMNWAVRSCKRPPTAKNQVQAECTACGRRPRLDPSNIDVYYDKESAEEARDKKNNGGLL
jgi:hypothetical protein